MGTQYFKRVFSDPQSVKTEIIKLKDNLATSITKVKPAYSRNNAYRTEYTKIEDEPHQRNYAYILKKLGATLTTEAEFEMFNNAM